MKVVAIANEKGGVGKTTSTLIIADFLARRGRKVLVVDMDPQDNVRLLLRQGESASSMREVLFGQAPLSSVVARVVRLWYAPAGQRLREADMMLSRMASEADEERRVGSLHVLRKVMAGAEEMGFDVVLVDTAPALGGLTTNSLVAADGMIVPFEPEVLAYNQMLRVLHHARSVRTHFNPELEVLGVLPTMVRPRVAEHDEFLQKVAKELDGSVRLFLPVPESAAVSAYFGAGDWVGRGLGSGTGQAAANAYSAVADRIEEWAA